MRRFDYSFLKKMPLDSGLLETAMGIGRYVERSCFRSREFPSVFEELHKTSKFMSVRGSNEIENIITTDFRMKALMEHSVEPEGHDEMEIAGYRDALDAVHIGHQDMGFDQNVVLRLFEIMQSYVPGAVTGYKQVDNVILEETADGERKVRFRTVSAEDAQHAMEQAVLALREAWQDPEISKILLIPCFVLDFLSIHPFEDGNGRMSRLISVLLYYQAGIDVCRYISLEEKINNSKAHYYRALSESSFRWHEGNNDYAPFIKYFMNIIFMCYRDLDSRFATVAGKKVNKTSRVEAVVLNSLVPVTKRQICEKLPDVSVTTVETVLSKMLKDGTIEKIGNNKGARYRRRTV